MYSLGDIIREHDKKNISKTKLSDVGILSVWEDVVGPEIAKNTAPTRIYNGTLYIKTKSPSWSQELRALDTSIKRKINEAVGKESVKELRFSHDNFSKENISANSTENAPPINLIEVDDEEIESAREAANLIKDDGLKENVAGIIVKSKKLNKWRNMNGWRVCERCGSMMSGDGKACIYCG